MGFQGRAAKGEMEVRCPCRVDGIDLRIMRHMGISPFLAWPHPPSATRPAAVARALGVGVDTVKRRLAALREAGVYHGLQVAPNPLLVGYRVVTFHARAKDATAKAAAVRKLAGGPGIVGTVGMVGGDCCFDVAYRSDAERDALRARIAAAFGVDPVHFIAYPLPIPRVEPTPLDWRILQALRRDPAAGLDAVAKDLGVSARTVKRRHDRLAKGGAFDVVGVFDPGAVAGQFVAYLLVHFAPGSGPEEAPRVLNAFRERWLAQWTPPERELGHLALVTAVSSARELEELRREAESIPNVARCEALVLQDAAVDWGVIDREVEARAVGGRPPLAAVAR
jgi:DNA-binding Lrp family transcriptional regulator